MSGVEAALHEAPTAAVPLPTAGGRCAGCHEAIEPALHAFAPAVSVCFDCLSAAERRALERDLEAAARAQRALLPTPRLAHAGWEVAWLWEPRGAVSGDHVDLFAPAATEDPIHLQLGDVVGKGIAASLLQSHLHALFRVLAPQALPLGDLLGRVNHHFHRAIGQSSFATLVAARLDADGTLELANAGHPRPLLADARGVRPIEGGDLPLGVLPTASYHTRRVPLAPGDTVLLYTDGLTESSRDDEEYGTGRAAAALRQAARLPLPELLADVRSELDRFLAGSPRSDDLTLLALRRTAKG